MKLIDLPWSECALLILRVQQMQTEYFVKLDILAKFNARYLMLLVSEHGVHNCGRVAPKAEHCLKLEHLRECSGSHHLAQPAR